MREIKENKTENNRAETVGMRVIHGDDQRQDSSTGRCLAFAEAARLLGMAVRGQELATPSFRSPPREVGRRRTLSRHDDGSVTVSVMVRNRVWKAVLADMIEGIVAANRMNGIDAEALRDHLWEALEGQSAQREAA
ncbi:MAG: hypothetical protein F4Z06_01315 [Acidimicrobiia bacterium]|nr:hypothetical protein [Acidimicrobiia bacterium]MYE73085.1 hypothetical protein [Acidimicrobiia bacterium]MYJ63584.1 hypothetical protein [Acidimicrobiia bacterium]